MTQAAYLQKGAVKVYIESAKIDEILSDKLIKIQRVVIEKDRNTRNPGTMIVGLARYEHVFNIQGYLSNSSGSGNEGYANAKAVKDALITDIIYSSGDIELHYRDYVDKDYGDKYGDGSTGASTDHIKCHLDKVQITDASLRSDKTGGSGTARYLIQLNLTRGKLKST